MSWKTFVCVALTAWTVASGSAAAPTLPDAAALHDTLQFLARKHGICNVSAAVVQNRQVRAVAAAQGCAADVPLAPDAVFEAASLSKPVFAYAVLKLVQAGKMALDAPVMNYLPGGYVHRFHPYGIDSPTDLVQDPRLQAVTVRMALNHTAGLPNWSSGPLAFDFLPGQRWQYSGEGYALLQRAVEAVTHENLAAYMTRAVFEPLGMRHSAYTRQPGLEKYTVPGTTRDGTPLKPWPFQVPVAAFTLYTSAPDYGAFLAALLDDAPTLRQIVAAPVPVDARLKLAWGQGWGLENRGSELFIWQWGNNPGYRAFVMASPQTGNGFVMFSASDKGLDLAEPLGQFLLPGPHPAFKFPLLREGLDQLLCESLDICL